MAESNLQMKANIQAYNFKGIIINHDKYEEGHDGKQQEQEIKRSRRKKQVVAVEGLTKMMYV